MKGVYGSSATNYRQTVYIFHASSRFIFAPSEQEW